MFDVDKARTIRDRSASLIRVSIAVGVSPSSKCGNVRIASRLRAYLCSGLISSGETANVVRYSALLGGISGGTDNSAGEIREAIGHKSDSALALAMRTTQGHAIHDISSESVGLSRRD